MEKKPNIGMLVGFACGVSVMAMLNGMLNDSGFPMSRGDRAKLIDQLDRAAEEKAIAGGASIERIQQQRRTQYALLLEFLNDAFKKHKPIPAPPAGSVN